MIFFTDRNLGHMVPIAMSLLGIEIEMHDAHFDQFTFDDVWLPVAGRNGWRVLTQDPKFLSNENERRAVVDYGVGCFVLVVDQLRAWEKLRVIARAWDEIERISKAEAPPYIYRISKTGVIRRLYPPPDQASTTVPSAPPPESGG